MRGGYAEKIIGDRYIMSRIIGKFQNHYLVVYEDKEYLWERILAKNKK